MPVKAATVEKIVIAPVPDLLAARRNMSESGTVFASWTVLAFGTVTAPVAWFRVPICQGRSRQDGG
jgi:hypothetical protein